MGLTENNLPGYYDYKLFLQKRDYNISLKKHNDYIKQYSFFNTITSLLSSALYILNFETHQYLYVGESCYNISGYTANEYIEKGRDFFLSQVHPEDMKFITSEVFSKFISYAINSEKTNLKNLRFSVNYRIKRKDGEYIKVIQQYVVLETSPEGYPLLTLGLITDATAHIQDNKVTFSVSKYDAKDGVKLISAESYSDKELYLSSRESEILRLIVKGISSKIIAQKLFISLYTVNAHRRNILEKTGCKNIAELINYSILHGLV